MHCFVRGCLSETKREGFPFAAIHRYSSWKSASSDNVHGWLSLLTCWQLTASQRCRTRHNGLKNTVQRFSLPSAIAQRSYAGPTRSSVSVCFCACIPQFIPLHFHELPKWDLLVVVRTASPFQLHHNWLWLIICAFNPSALCVKFSSYVRLHYPLGFHNKVHLALTTTFPILSK